MNTEPESGKGPVPASPTETTSETVQKASEPKVGESPSVADVVTSSDRPSDPDASGEASSSVAAVPLAGGAESLACETDGVVSKTKIRIGSQRDVAKKTFKPKAVEAATQNPVQLGSPEAEVSAPAEDPIVIGSMAGLEGDLDAEIEAALGGVSMDQVINETQADEEQLQAGSRVKGAITKIYGENVFVSLKGRFEGVVPATQFKKVPTTGDLVEVIVKGQNPEDGLYELSIPGASVSVDDWSELDKGMVVEARVTGSNTGGLEASVQSIRAFIPASQIERFRVENFGDYVGKKLLCVVQEVNPGRKKLVISHRAVLERELEEKRKELLAKIEVGQEYDGVVTKLMDFGAFVDIGGAEGLVHISKLSWDRVAHPKDVVAEGEAVKVKIEKVNAETGKISLSRRDTMAHPWDGIESKYPVESTVSGTVSRIADFGAFVRLEPGIEGLIHISELAHHRVVKVKNVVKEGDSVEVKILSLDRDAQKMGLSLKATQAKPERKEKQKSDEPDEPLRELAVKKSSDEPLKGGTSRATGGEEIGLTLG